MPDQRYRIAGLGEVLWDVFPEGKQLGGAPANFAYISTLLGNQGIVASRIGGNELGEDALGREAVEQLKIRGLDTSYIQRDPHNPTGTVNVTVNDRGIPSYKISQPVAWDFLDWSDAWRALAQKVDAFCFGSLAQRSQKSRQTIQAFVKNTRPEAVRVFDVNLRQSFYSAEVLLASCELADVVKMNDEEFPRVLQLADLPSGYIDQTAQAFCKRFNLKLLCVTRGQHGSLLFTPDLSHSHPGITVQIADTVGAGDAFTAGLVSEYLRHRVLDLPTLGRMNETANRMGAWVAGQFGGMPENKGPRGELRDLFSR